MARYPYWPLIGLVLALHGLVLALYRPDSAIPWHTGFYIQLVPPWCQICILHYNINDYPSDEIKDRAFIFSKFYIVVLSVLVLSGYLIHENQVKQPVRL